MSLTPDQSIVGKEVVILGLCRNVSAELENDVRRLQDSFQDFSKIHFRFVESDSTDSTLEVLRALQIKLPNFNFVTLGNLQEQIPERVARICYCRNVCLDILKDDPLLADCAYVVVSDLDGVNTLLTRSAITSCWTRNDWDACMANQAAPYYDIYALRHPIWSPDDCWHYESKLRSEGMNPLSARQKAIYSRMITIDPSSEWIPVDSAFGGLAIYKRELFDNVRYSSILPNGDHVCEHVTLHQQMTERGAKLYINPSLINLGWNTHSASKKFGKRFKRGVKLVLWKLIPMLRKRLF
jgi:glycosyltransferase involved in cell wall biosynthesis